MNLMLLPCILTMASILPVISAAEPFFQKQLVLQRPSGADHYRGPRIIQMPDGTIVASGILKLGHMLDVGAKEEIRHVCSVDDGRTWQETTNHQMGCLVDETAGTVFDTDRYWPLNDATGEPMSEAWMINNPRKGVEIGAWVKFRASTDNGMTWTSRDLTDEFFMYKDVGLAWFIGHGIQLQRGPHKGRLIIPGRHFGARWEKVGPHACNTLAYSDDHGQTWHWGGESQGCTGEACIVELADGSVYINNRNHDPKTNGYRSWAISRDGGASFTEFGVAHDLPEPKCHASMARYSFPDEKTSTPGRVLFLNPSVSIRGSRVAPAEGRKNLTVKVSYDDCRTWPVAKTIFPGKGGYSDIIVTKDGTILCVFECGEEMYAENIGLARFNIEWLESGFVPKTK